MKIVRKNIEVKIYPTKRDINDNAEKIVSIDKIESNIGIYRFIYDEELEFINHFKSLLIQNGYDDKVKVNDSSCSVILDMLRQEYSFLEKAESSSRQQAQRDLINAFNRYYDSNLKSAYPVLKTKKKTKQYSFRIINNNNNVRITKDKNGYDKIKLAKLGIVKFKTSKEYRKLLQKGSDPNDESVKIKHVTIKNVHGTYHAVFNIEQIHVPEKIIGPKMQMGIDIGCSSGASIVAAADGVVSYVGYLGAAGNAVLIDHGNGLTTCYFHLSGFNTSVGANVSAGDTVGFAGSTGVSTGPHLHFAVRLYGSYVNPMGYL